MSQDLPQIRHERDEKRIHVAIPIRVTCFDEHARPRLELACTYDISAHGARITGLRSVKKEGEILVVERGRNKAYCRVAWIGADDSPLRGQVGIQSVESARTLWNAELRDMREVYDSMPRETGLQRMNAAAGPHNGNRRRQVRFSAEGMAELSSVASAVGSGASQFEGTLKDLSENGCLITAKDLPQPGTELKLVLKISKFELGFKGEVRHSAPGVGLGIAFREIRKGDRAVLQHLLRKLAESGSPREPAESAAATGAR